MIYKINKKLLEIGSKEEIVKDRINNLELELVEISYSDNELKKIQNKINNTLEDIDRITKNYAINVKDYKQVVINLGRHFILETKGYKSILEATQ